MTAVRPALPDLACRAPARRRHALLRLPALLPLAAALLLARPAQADEPAFLYALAQAGQLSVWGTVLDDLPSAPSTGRYADLLVLGDDRVALRKDGRVFVNGQLTAELGPPSLLPGAAWIVLRRISDLLALSSAGRLAGFPLGPGEPPVFADLPGDGALFVDLLVGGAPTLLALRTDGVLVAPDGTRVGRLDDGPAADPELLGPLHREWVRLADDPLSDDVLALRADGRLVAFDPALLLPSGVPPGGDPVEPPVVGVEVALLPFDEAIRQRNDVYVDLETDADGAWLVLRRDGAVFAPTHLVQPLLPQVGFPFFGTPAALDPLGGGSTTGNPFVDLLVAGPDLWRLRSLGHVHRNGEGNAFTDLVNSRYVRLGGSSIAPDLDGVPNRPPVLAVYKVKAIEGQPLSVPLLSSDVDQPGEVPTFELDFELLPGGSFDALSGTVLVPGDLPPGKYRFRVTVLDGEGEPQKASVFKVRVLPADAEPANKKPAVSRVKTVQALVGVELVLPLLAVDADGDALAAEPASGKGAFLLGAVLDGEALQIVWTPDVSAVGRRDATVLVRDGDKTRKLPVKIDVVFPLGAIPEPPPPPPPPP